MTSIFNPNIPQANDDPTVSQSQLLGNFGKLNSDWAVNHIPLTSGGNNGFHKFVQFPTVLGSDPTLTGLQSQVYPKTDGNGNTALFYANASNVYQLTDLTIVNPGAGNDFGFVTPWGFTINAGFIPAGITTVTFAVPYAKGTVYTLEITPQFASSSSLSFSIKSITIPVTAVTGFKINTSSSSAAYYYFSIGV